MSLWMLVFAIGLSFWIFRVYRVNHQQEYAVQKISISSNNSQSMNPTPSQSCTTNLQQQEYAIALANCKQVVEDDADNLAAHLNLGLAYYHLENYHLAIAQYKLAIELNPHDYQTFYNWGLVNSSRGEYQQAIDCFQTALNFIDEKLKSEQALILNDLGAAQIMFEQYQVAIANLDRAAKLDPSSPAVYFNRGCAHHHKGNYQQGIADFTHVIALNPDYTEAYISRAILYHLIRHEKAAYSDLDVALQHYQAQGDREAYQKIIGLKNSIITSKVTQTA